MLKKNWILFPLIVPGFYYIFWSVKYADEEMLFDSIIYSLLIILFLIFFTISVFKDLKKYKNSRLIQSFIPSIIGGLFLLSFGIINFILEIRDNSPVLIQAGNDGGFNGAWFDFRKDGTYKFVNSGGIGADIFRGKYEIKDSIIILDKKDIDNFIKSDKLAIREIKNYDSTFFKVLYQIDENHKIIDKQSRFTINEDKRTE